MTTGKLKTWFEDVVLHGDINEWRNPVKRWCIRQVRLLYYTGYSWYKHGTLVRSAALTYYTLMALVPIVAVIFAVVKGFGLAGELVQNLYSLFPQNPEIVDYLVGFADKALARTQGGVVAAVALVMLFWSVISVFSSIESAFNHIWEVKRSRSITRQYTDYLAAILIVPILWIVTNAAAGFASDLFGTHHGTLYTALSYMGAMAAIWAVFTLLYIIIPNARVKFRSALLAGILAGTVFLLFQWGYVYLQRWMTSYNAIYGSFAALPLLLIWMQTSWQILLFGGELSFAFQNIERFGEERESLLISYDERRKVILAVMLTVIRRFREVGGATPADEIRRYLDLPTRIVNDVLFQLEHAGELIAVRGDDNNAEVAYAPAHEISAMTTASVMAAVERCGDTALELPTTTDISRIDREIRRIKASIESSEGNVKLIDLL